MSEETETAPQPVQATEPDKPRVNPPIKPPNRKTSFSIQRYIDEALKVWGGPREFALVLRREFNEARPGSPTRYRMLDLMMTWIKMQHDLLPKGTAAVEELTNDELAKELHSLLEENDEELEAEAESEEAEV